MKGNRVLNITYHSYWKDEDNSFNIQPYCVKLFRQRWYLVARSTDSYFYEKGPMIYALDRIINLHQTEETFKMPKDWDAEAYFEGCFGVIVGHQAEAQDVKLKVTAGQANYIRDLKMHDSQEEIERNEEYNNFLKNERYPYQPKQVDVFALSKKEQAKKAKLAARAARRKAAK